ncbi:MAG: hypothetical protein KQH67_09150 [Bacteroidetes bacterium]|nr:hypothetical protein [Bacteroidota bacterium]
MKILSAVGLILITASFLVGQGNIPLQSKVEEQVVFNTDREIYLPGEIIWFDADYLINGEKSNEELSKILYVELFSFTGKSLVKGKFEINDEKASGNLTIPFSIQTGYYLLRAYTQYQRNLDPVFITNKVISIINPIIPLSKPALKKDTLVRAFFMGNRNGTQSAFGLYFSPQMAKSFKKTIIIGSNIESQIPVQWLTNGMGFFDMSFERQSNYHFIGVADNGDTIVRSLRFVWPEIEISIRDDQILTKIGLKFSNQSPEFKDGEYILSLYSPTKQKIIETKINISDQKCLLQWPGRIFHSGINYLIMKSIDGDILFSKAVYQFPEEPFHLPITTDKEIYETREKVSVEIETDQLPVVFGENYTISVVKSGTATTYPQVPVYVVTNPQLLASWLQNLSTYPASLVMQVDLLMAIYTEWLNVEKNQIANMSEETIRWLPEIRGVTIRGVVRETGSGNTVPGIDVMLSVLGSEPQLQIFRTDKNGEFLFAVNHISDLTNVYLTLKSSRENELEILIESDFMNEYPLFTEPDFVIDTNMREMLTDMYINAQVSGRVIHEDTLTEVVENVFRFEPDETVFLNDFVAMQSFESVINEIVPNIKIRKRSQHYYFKIYDDITGVYYEDPLVLIDNLPIYNIDELLSIHPSLIEKIELINHTYIYGDYIMRGMVAIYTSTDNFGNITLPDSFTSLEFQAISQALAFTPSNYQTKEQKVSRTPDFRNVLYWNPNFHLTDMNNKLSFYTSDHASNYEIVIKATSANGKVIIGRKEFKVE